MVDGIVLWGQLEMKAATNGLFVRVLGVMMIPASTMFTAVYPSIRKEKDSGSDSSGSVSGGNANDGSGNGKSDPEPRPPKDDQNGKSI